MDMAASSSPSMTFLCKKTLCLKWVINDAAETLEFQELRSPYHSVLLRPAAGSEPAWDSQWHLVLKGHEHSLGLCQGKYADLDDYLDEWYERNGFAEDFMRKVMVSNVKFSILNHNTQEAVFTDSDGCDKEINICNEEPLWFRHKVIDFTKYIFSDKLSIKVEADLSFAAPLSGGEWDVHVPRGNFRADMYTLYKKEMLTDTVVKCDDKEFKVHRAVFASQSPVFLAMFQTDMKEKQSGIIEVSDITPAVMSDLVTYLYTGSAPNLGSLVNELLDVAGKYQLPHLFRMCESELGKKMKDTSVIETLILADLHGRPSLKKACLKYIRLNSAKVLQTREWVDFKDRKDQYASLIMEILEHTLHT